MRIGPLLKRLFFLGVAQVIGHVFLYQSIWLTAESWKRIDERKGRLHWVRANMTRAKSLEVQCSMRRDKRRFVIALVLEGEDATKRINFRSVCCITKELVSGRKSLAGSMKGVSGRLPR